MGFTERWDSEIALLREYYVDLEYKQESGHWIRIPAYPLPDRWSSPEVPVVFEVKESHPGTPPYGIYVPTDLKHDGHPPNNRNDNPPQPPFEGRWMLLSWAPQDGQWRSTGDLRTGSNLLQWARGFAERFAQGQ